MLDHILPEDILFLDIETVPQYPDFAQLDETAQHLWELKAATFCKEEQTPAEVYERAGIYAEFGKIVCISAGFLYKQTGEWAFRLKSCFSEDEATLLNEFSGMVARFASGRAMQLCAHNGKEFDFPYIARRMLINAIRLPSVLDIAGKKPWETAFLDTMDLWRFGDRKSYTSLKLLTHAFGIPSPKDDIDGSQVAGVFWKEKDLLRIVRYCEKDVLAIARLLLRYKGLTDISPDRITSATFTTDQ
ncbi:MAG: ribonuclease H-like domain-containing protein [Bacteroidales bacterium]|jgi:DNA polymerase elongation subunit (family B)|nr:ribonuclease H-like domain-containing protein [Bacteroidales bacterium]